MKKDRKTAVASFAVKATDDAARTFTGLASTWELDEGGDIVHQGAYARTLSSWRNSNGKRIIPLIDQHNYGSVRKVVGKLVDAKETDAGLETTWQIVEGADGDEVLNRLKGGFVNGLSIGYEVVQADDEQITQGGQTTYIRHLRELKLFEVSLVIWGMNEGALIDTSSVKARLIAGRKGDIPLSDEEKVKLASGLKDARDEIDALLEQIPSEKKADADPPALADEAATALRQRLLRLKLNRLATRRGRPGTLAGTDTHLPTNEVAA